MKPISIEDIVELLKSPFKPEDSILFYGGVLIQKVGKVIVDVDHAGLVYSANGLLRLDLRHDLTGTLRFSLFDIEDPDDNTSRITSGYSINIGNSDVRKMTIWSHRNSKNPNFQQISAVLDDDDEMLTIKAKNIMY